MNLSNIINEQNSDCLWSQKSTVSITVATQRVDNVNKQQLPLLILEYKKKKKCLSFIMIGSVKTIPRATALLDEVA